MVRWGVVCAEPGEGYAECGCAGEEEEHGDDDPPSPAPEFPCDGFGEGRAAWGEGVG